MDKIKNYCDRCGKPYGEQDQDDFSKRLSNIEIECHDGKSITFAMGISSRPYYRSDLQHTSNSFLNFCPDCILLITNAAYKDELKKNDGSPNEVKVFINL